MSPRERRGWAIANKGGQIVRVDNGRYEVKSQYGSGTYDVMVTDAGWTCSCPDHQGGNAFCKHIYAVKFTAGTGGGHNGEREETANREIGADVRPDVLVRAPRTVVRD